MSSDQSVLQRNQKHIKMIKMKIKKDQCIRDIHPALVNRNTYSPNCPLVSVGPGDAAAERLGLSWHQRAAGAQTLPVSSWRLVSSRCGAVSRKAVAARVCLRHLTLGCGSYMYPLDTVK